MTVAKRADRRPTLTLKGEEFNNEFRALLNKAAKKAGKTQAEFAAEALAAAARKTLASTPDDTPPGNPLPVTIPPEILERQEATDKKLAELADQVRALTELQQKTLWARIRGRFRP